ncbi:MAG: hypothetical protein GC145_09290 [Caulobacter sp.]|nr:hypothetical protein [Caulobacter sp.]
MTDQQKPDPAQPESPPADALAGHVAAPSVTPVSITAETQAVYPPPRPPMTAQEQQAARQAQSKRNVMLGLSLVAFIVIVFLVTVLKMGGYVVR